MSNSTWANYGYLVAVEIKEDVISELILLNVLHGIGGLELDVNMPEKSRIRIQSLDSPVLRYVNNSSQPMGFPHSLSRKVVNVS